MHCLFQDGHLCPNSPEEKPCPQGYSGKQVWECREGEVVVINLCIADWIHDVDSMVSKRNVNGVKKGREERRKEKERD